MNVLKASKSYIDTIASGIDGLKMLLLDQDTTSMVSLACSQSFLLEHEIYVTDRIDNPARGITTGNMYPPSTSSQVVERMPFLTCICILRPTTESINHCVRELREARYGAYYLYFTNTLTRRQVEALADADVEEKVHELQEIFLDYLPLSDSHFTLGLMPTPGHPQGVEPFSNAQSTDQETAEDSQRVIPAPRIIQLYGNRPFTFAPNDVESRHVSGITAALLALGKKPLVRYEGTSSMARRVASGVAEYMEKNEDLWSKDTSRNGGLNRNIRNVQGTKPVLLILDRRDDPVTPLLNQWTFEAMVHELLGLHHGRVFVGNQQLVVSGQPEQDAFFAANKNEDFGKLSDNLNSAVKTYADKSSTSDAKNIKTLADMKAFVQNYPEFKKMSGNISKHVTLVSAISSLVDKYELLTVSELEQNIVCTTNHNQDEQALEALISAPEIEGNLKLRVAMLYALRYQKYSAQQIPRIIRLLKEHGVDGDQVNLVLNFAGTDADARGTTAAADLYPHSQGTSFLTRNTTQNGLLRQIIRRVAAQGVGGAVAAASQGGNSSADLPEENVFTRHTPLLVSTLEHVLRGQLSMSEYPVAGKEHQAHQSTNSTQGYHSGNGPAGGVPGATSIGTNSSATSVAEAQARSTNEVIVFIIGGTTFEEARNIELLNEYFGYNISEGTPPLAPGSGTRVILGGTCVHNSASFMAMMQDAALEPPAQAMLTKTALHHEGPPITSSGPMTLDSVRDGLGQKVDDARDTFGQFLSRVIQ